MIFDKLLLFGLIEMIVFIALVFVAYVYVWKKGGFDWEPRAERAMSVGARDGRRREVAGAR